MHNARTDAMLNGALIAVGALGIVDNIVVHWLLELHRAIPGPHATTVEVILIWISALLLATGILREVRARKRAKSGGPKS
jgi:uncharacterized membrane protein